MTEEELKYKVSYQNLLLYSLVLPQISDDNEASSSSSEKPVDMFSLFNGFNTH